MNEAKRRNIPAPGHYTVKDGEKPLLGHSDKSEKRSYHID